jgi:hypothetical protein
MVGNWIYDENLRPFWRRSAYFVNTGFDDDDWIGLEYDLILRRDQLDRERHVEWPLGSRAVHLYFEPGSSGSASESSPITTSTFERTRSCFRSSGRLSAQTTVEQHRLRDTTGMIDAGSETAGSVETGSCSTIFAASCGPVASICFSPCRVGSRCSSEPSSAPSATGATSGAPRRRLNDLDLPG